VCSELHPGEIRFSELLFVVGKLVEEEETADAAAALNVLPGWGKWGGAGIVAKGKKPRSKMT